MFKLYSLIFLCFVVQEIYAESKTVDYYYNRNATKCSDINCIRTNIDELNDKIIEYIAIRTAYVKRAGDIKQKIGKADDRKRVDDQLISIKEKSSKLLIPDNITLNVFRELIENSIEYEQKYIDSKNKG